MMSWDIVFWANKESVDYIPSCWAVDDEEGYKWPQGVSQEVRLCLIRACDPLNNVKYRVSKGTAKRKGIKDLEKAKRLCEKAMYSSSVETTTDADIEDQTEDNTHEGRAAKPENRNSHLQRTTHIIDSDMRPDESASTPTAPINSVRGFHKIQNPNKFNATNSSDENDDSVLLNTFACLSKSPEIDITADSPASTPTRSKRSITEDSNRSAKKAKNDASRSLSIDENLGLDTNETAHDESQPKFTAAEKVILKEITKMNWEISDTKKTINQIHDLLLVNYNTRGNIDNLPTEQWQLPIVDNAALEALEEFFKQELSENVSLNATETEIEKSISTYLAGAGDREGGRKNRTTSTI